MTVFIKLNGELFLIGEGKGKVVPVLN